MNKKFEADAGAIDAQTVKRRYAHRSADVRADVIVPFLQSFVGCVAVTAALILLQANPRIAAGVGILVFCVAWVILLIDHRRGLWMLEEFTGLDLDYDGVVGEPEPEVVRVEIVRDEQGARGMSFLDLPIKPSELRQIAELVINQGVAFSRDGLSGVLSQPRYNRLAQTMEDRGLLVKMSNNRRVLTKDGRATMKAVLNPPARTDASRVA